MSGEGEVSGLADMLHQFIEQTLSASPRKARQARRLTGDAVFRSAEDDDISVRIRFAGDRIELYDGGVPAAGDALICADFLTIAHLTAGRESPLGLLARRRLKVDFSLRQLPFLLRMLRFLQIDTAASAEQRHVRRVRWLWPIAAAAAAAVAVYWYATAAP